MQTISEPEAILPALASHVTNECHVLVLGGNQRDERERERERETETMVDIQQISLYKRCNQFTP